jgi:MFS family permease
MAPSCFGFCVPARVSVATFGMAFSLPGGRRALQADYVEEASFMKGPALKRPHAVPIDRATAIRFILLLGTISLFADMTYEGARGIAGPYLGVLGSSAVVVGVVAGLGELFGYCVRLLSGWIGDRTQRYWLVMLAGYALNLFSVPLLALTQHWQAAAILIVLERIGRGIRSPIRDAMLSHAANHTGLGWGFGVHEAMDQSGAVIGPLVVAAALYLHYGYRQAFAVLLVPALLSIGLLLVARFLYPRPRDFDLTPPALKPKGLRQNYWLFVIAMALIGAGSVDFALIGYHFGHTGVLSPPLIPVAFAVAMASDAAAALILGRLFDRFGMPAVIGGVALAAAASPLVFLGGAGAVLAGMVLWGVGMGTHESVNRAVVAGMTAPDRRATAFGILNAFFGVAWFLGSVAFGILYGYSVLAVVLVSLALQLCALPLLLLLTKGEAGGYRPRQAEISR